DGYNFEDAIIISERLVKNDTYTSIHIEEFEIEIRETKLGKEESTRDIPNVSPKALSNLDEHGVVQLGTFVHPGDILVGKVSPKSRSELTPEEKLLHAIFGRAGEDVKNDSLEVPSGVEGIVIATHRFSRRASMSEDQLKKAKKIHERHWERIQFFIDEQERRLNSLKRGDELPSGVQQMVKVYVATKRVISVGDKMAGRHGNKGVISKVLPEEDMPFL